MRRNKAMSGKIMAAALLSALAAAAAQPGHAVEIKPGGLVYSDYQYVASNHLRNGAAVNPGYNTFDVTRVYLWADVKVDDVWSAYVRLEDNAASYPAGGSPPAGSTNGVYLKNAELRAAFFPWLKTSFGLVGTPWIGFEEDIWQQRFVAKTFADEEGLFPSTDRGLKVSGKVPFVAYDLMVSNGGGTGGLSTAGNETPTLNAGGRLKDYQAKVSVTPFETMGDLLKGFKINALGYKGEASETTTKDRILGGVSYESAMFNIMATYVNTNNDTPAAPSRGEGFSIHTVVKPTEKFWVFARFDRLDPDVNVGGDMHNRYIYGIGYQPAKFVRLAIDQQYLQQETTTAARADENSVFFHTEVKF